MFDIHCHILPGVDDGSEGLFESVKMAEIAAESGTTGIVVTPHANIPDSYENYFDDEYKSRFRELEEELKANNIPVKLYTGQEIFCAGRMLSLLREGKLITINKSRYLLMEFSMHEHTASALKKVEQVVAEGYVPILAHPERYAFVQENPDIISRIKRMGCFIQLNKGSMAGDFGRGAYYVADRLLSMRMADFVASDAHTPYFRTPFMEDAHEYISETYSMNYADFLFDKNPNDVISNKQIDIYY